MKSDWEVRNFEECLADVVYTKKIQRKDFLDNGIYPIISQEKKDVNGYWNDPEDLFKIRKPVVIFGDHTQVIKYIDFDFVLGADGVKILQPKDGLNSKFFYYYLINSDLEKLGYARHYRLLKEKVVTYPRHPEQLRIVAMLDDTFDAIAKAKENAKKNLQNARELFEAYFQSVFANIDDECSRFRINDVCESIMDCVNKTAPTVNEITPFKMIRTTNVRNGQVNLTSVNYVTEDIFKIWTRRQEPRIGDVILTREAPLGEVGMLRTTDKVFLGQRLVSYRTDQTKLDNNFLLYSFQADDLQRQIRGLASGATVQHMRVPDSKALKILVPSLPEQRAIVTKLDAFSSETKKLETIYNQKLADLDELKKSILQKAFNGEL